MKELSKEVREIMKEYIGDNSVAGVTVLAVQDGKEICDCQEGMADIENGRVMKRDTIFRLYSQTKPVTGAAAMILMERGKLDLYQPVAEYLPAFREQKIWRNGRCEALLPGEREMLVVDLLRMTSGLIYGDTTTEPGRMLSLIHICKRTRWQKVFCRGCCKQTGCCTRCKKRIPEQFRDH